MKFFFFLNILSLISLDNRIVTILLNHHKLKLHTTLFSEMLFVLRLFLFLSPYLPVVLLPGFCLYFRSSNEEITKFS